MNIGHGQPLPPTKQGSAEWLEQRRDGIGGSDISAIMGISPWSGPHDVYASKVHGDDGGTSIPMRVGSQLEPLVMDMLREDTGLDIITDVPHGYHHPDYPWARASLDGAVVSAGAPVGIAEGKTTSRKPWARVPDHYAAQVQWYMWVVGLETAWVGCLFGNRDFDHYIIEADPALQQGMAQAAEDFWLDHVLPQQMPAVDASKACASNLAHEYGARDERVELGELAETLLAERADITASISAAYDVRREIDNRVMAELAGATRGAVPDWTVTVQSKPRLDKRALMAAHPELTAQYLTELDVKALRKAHPDIVAEFETAGAPYLVARGRK
jgi:putative phage-type endonuclease